LLDDINKDKSTTMLIFRSKNELGWTDRHEVKAEVTQKLYGSSELIEDV
jgi:hypothetical protein